MKNRVLRGYGDRMPVFMGNERNILDKIPGYTYNWTNYYKDPKIYRYLFYRFYLTAQQLGKGSEYFLNATIRDISRGTTPLKGLGSTFYIFEELFKEEDEFRDILKRNSDEYFSKINLLRLASENRLYRKPPKRVKIWVNALLNNVIRIDELYKIDYFDISGKDTRDFNDLIRNLYKYIEDTIWNICKEICDNSWLLTQDSMEALIETNELMRIIEDEEIHIIWSSSIAEKIRKKVINLLKIGELFENEKLKEIFKKYAPKKYAPEFGLSDDAKTNTDIVMEAIENSFWNKEKEEKRDSLSYYVLTTIEKLITKIKKIKESIKILKSDLKNVKI